VAACLVLVAVAILLVFRLHHPPHRVPAGAGPGHTPSPGLGASPASTIPPVPSLPAPSVSVRGPSPSAVPRVTPSPPPASPSPRAVTPGPSPSGLVAGPYGFSYPAGWTAGPLVTRDAQVTTETVTDPAGGGRIDYLKDTSTAAYYPDHTVNDVAIEATIETALPCAQIVSTTTVPYKGFSYTCAPSQGFHVAGMALVAPYAQGFRLLQVRMLPAGDPVAAAILAGFH
jgi:hypothetical protein